MRSEKQRRLHLAWWRDALGRVPLADLRQPALLDARGRPLAEKVEKTGKRGGWASISVPNKLQSQNGGDCVRRLNG
jgi:hypothetical protein